MKTFKINDKYEITCTSEKTRYGFRHLANLYRTGLSGTTVLVEKAKECYYNRTWESFEYETVINNLLTKAKIMPEEQIKEFLECCRKDNLEEVNKQFGFIAGIAKLGEILCNTQSEVNDWKERMIKAGLGDRGLIMPDDWHRLSEDEKERRLNGVINELSK
jgi:hypothetical protein